MNNKNYLSAIAGIDEDLIARAERKNEEKVMSKNIKRKKMWLPIAACLVVAFIAVGFFTFGQGKSPSVEISTTSEEKSSNTGLTAAKESNSSVSKNEIETVTTNSNSSNNTNTNTYSAQSSINKKQDSQSNSNENKGGNTPERLQDYRIGTDGGSYKVFKPGVDKFEPIDDMTLENRFCSFYYNGHSYYPVPDGEITKGDYESNKLTSVKAEHWELRSANAEDEISGIIYYAKIDLYKLKGVDTSEAVACVISFNGETKEYRYNAA